MLTSVSQVLQCGKSKPIKRKYIRPLLIKVGHGSHAVVTINAGDPKEHNVNVVNVRGKVYLVDAYNVMPTMAIDVDARLDYGTTFQISFVWGTHVMPIEKVASFQCP